MFAAEVQFLKPEHRSVQIVPEAKHGHYLLTFYDRRRALPTLERLPFRLTQWTAVKNGFKQPIYLAQGKLEITPDGDHIAIALDVAKLPAFTLDAQLGTILMSDFEKGLGISENMVG